jgi:hypothetical protein
LRLIPRDTRFYDLFAQSAENAVAGAKLYLKMLEQFDDPKASHRLIREQEHAGDEITHAIIRQVNTTFVTPIDREDIHALATSLDDVMDDIEAASDMLILHRIEAPTQDAREQAQVLVRIAEAVAEAIRDLRRFKGLDKYWLQIKGVEHEGDQIYRRAIAELFNGDHRAMEVLKWKEIYDQVETAIDVCEDVGNLLEAIVLKHA